MAEGFEFRAGPRLLFGAGVAARAGELAGELGGKRALLVTDRGVLAAGHAGLVEESLRAAGLEVRRFEDVHENPTTRDVEACVAAARAARADLLVAVGGGSSIDAAKGCAFLLANGGRMEDYVGYGRAKLALPPLIAVPTTAGTGSEVQSYALISRAEDHGKMACGDPKAMPRVALLDPLLTLTQPPFVSACTGMDTVTHAVEAAVTRRASELSAIFAREAFRLASDALPRVLERPEELEARGAMLRAAAYAGTAIENGMLGAAHSLANPLTARYGLHHGRAVASVLPAVVRFNAAEPRACARYAELARAAGLAEAGEPEERAAEALAARVEALLRAAGFASGLAGAGVEERALPELAREAAAQWTARFNPRPVGAAELEGLYRASFAGDAR